MKKLMRLFRNWRDRRLYRKLFFFYAGKTDCAWNANVEARNAFTFLTGRVYPDPFEQTGDT